MRGRFATSSALLVVLAVTKDAMAVRPFITDDARVVGDKAVQLETWLRVDKRGLQHWAVPAVGPVGPLEMSLGAMYGTQDGKVGAALPLIQLKALALETKPGAIWPGLAVAGGAFGPGGAPPFKGDQWDLFGYLALSESLAQKDHVLVHQNLGFFVTTTDGNRRAIATWGIGTQIHVFDGLHFVGEVFSGDPYAGTPTGAFQAGARHFVSRAVQIDATFGHGLWGSSILPAWGSLGLRIASDPGFF